MSIIKEKTCSNSTKGIDFLDSFLSDFNLEIGSDWTFVGSVSSDFMKVRTVSLMHQDKLEKSIEYDTEHTPCEQVLNQVFVLFPRKYKNCFRKIKC